MLDESLYSMDWNTFQNSADEAAKAFPIKDVLKIHFGLDVNANGRCPCPIHGGTNPNLAVYTDSNTAHCYSDCDRTWNAITLVQSDLQNKGYTRGSYKKAFLTLCDEFGMDPLEFPGMRLRTKDPNYVPPKPKIPDLQKEFTKQDGPDWQRHLLMDRNPFLSVAYRDSDNKVHALKLSPEEAAFVVGQKLSEKAKKMAELIPDMEDSLHEDLTPVFSKLFKSYDDLLSMVQKSHPKAPKEDAVSLVSMSEREFNRTALGDVLSHPLSQEQSNYGRYGGSIPMKELPRTTPYLFPKLFDKDTEQTIWREFFLPVPHEKDIVLSPDGKTKAVPDLKEWASLAYDQVWAKKNHLFRLEKAMQEEFKDFDDPVVKEGLYEISQKIYQKNTLCNQMLKVLDDFTVRLDKQKTPEKMPEPKEKDEEMER